MKEGDKCPICEEIFGKEGIIHENMKSKSIDTKFDCSNNNTGLGIKHTFSFDGKLYRKRKTLGDHSMCPQCGHISSLMVCDDGAFTCHIVGCGFNSNNVNKKLF